MVEIPEGMHDWHPATSASVEPWRERQEEPVVGRTFSHYAIIEKLGEGGMGVVYKAEDTRLRRYVALKFLPHNLLVREEDRHRFVLEAQASASLSHPNIATVFEIDESEGKAFIVLEYIEGNNLSDKISSGPLTLDDALSIAIQICEGLQAAHEKGIVHRDIKSQNVMVTNRGQVKILDFGLAKLRGATAVTRAGTTLGTIAYMSPEQLRGEPVDQRSDLWAVGVILYEMVTGRRPFRGDYDEAVAYQVLNMEPDPLTAIRTGVPMELERIVKKLISRESQERYQSAEDLLVDLRSLRKAGDAPSTAITTAPARVANRKRLLLYGVPAIVVLLVGLGLLVMRQPERRPIESIAVLPLENLSHDPEQEYFADGMTEALTTELAQIEALKVISRTSVMKYKTGQRLMSEIARELNVDAVVEGSVQRSGSRVAITVQLIDARIDRHLWARPYERDLRDILSLQREAAHQIANEIKIALTQREERQLARATQVNPEALQLYLKGRYFWDKRTPQDMQKAIECFTRAIELDSMYALAYSGLADCYLFQSLLPRSESMPRAKAAALKALHIDSSLAEAHTTLGFVYMNFQWDWNAAEKELLQGLALKPNYPVAHQFYGAFLVLRGNPEKGIQEVRRALELDPLSLAINWHLGLMLFLTRRIDESVDQFRRTLQLQEDYALAVGGLANAYVQKGLYADAALLCQKMPRPLGRLAYVSAASGNVQDARAKLALILQTPDRAGLSQYDLAKVYATLGDADEAMKWLEEGYRERAFNMFFLNADPAFDPVRSDPRFAALLKKLGLEQL